MIFLLLACQSKIGTPFTEDEQLYIGRLQIEVAEGDETNSMEGNSDAVLFGEVLFFDERFSPDAISCATCHDPNHAFSDPAPLSNGVGQTKRHAPSLWGVNHQRWLNWDGSCDNLWCQATGPIEKTNEMGSTRTRLTHVIGENQDLRIQYERLFGNLPEHDQWPMDAAPMNGNEEHQAAWDDMSVQDRDAATTVLVNSVKAIAAFEATLTPPRAPIDDFADLFLTDQRAAEDFLTSEERRGLELFVGEAQCQTCHLGGLGTNLEFHNIGLPISDTLDTEDLGRYSGIDFLNASDFTSTGAYSDDTNGSRALRLNQLAQTSEQLGQFKVPHLRELTSSAPYMHSGQMETLETVVLHYSEMNDIPTQGHVDEFLTPQNWSDSDRTALLEFVLLFSSEE